MALNLDLSRAFRTGDERVALLKAIHAAMPEDETHWLEWKSSLDLGSTAGIFAIAKAILGFANRSPDQAIRACEGTAYMAVGVKPGAADGVTSIDNASLSQKLKTYAAGPRFEPFYVDFAGVTVLVIVVEPPCAGDHLHTLQKAYDKFGAGTIFHRGTAHTEPAGPREIEMLEERLLQGVRQPNLRLSLTADAQPLTRIYFDDETIEAWLAAREKSVRANSGEKPEKPKPAPKPPKSEGPGIGSSYGLSSSISESLAGIGDMMGRWADPKDREKFETSVSRYLDNCHNGLVDIVVRDIVRSAENKVTLRVHNDTDDSIEGVSVRARIPKGGFAVYDSPPSAPQKPPIPKWPEPYGDLLGSNPTAQLAHLDAPLAFGSTRSSVEDTDDYFEVNWNVGDVLAQDGDELEITIVAGMRAPEVIAVELEARAKSQRGVARASASLPVSSDEPWQLDNWWNPVLTD